MPTEEVDLKKFDKLKRLNKDLWLGGIVVVLSVLACYCVIWAFTEQNMLGESPYMSYVLQARRWLSGHLDLGQDYPYLELAVYNGKYFVTFPPVPSVILLPFVWMKTVPDNLITSIIGIIGAVYAYKLVYNIKQNAKTAVFFALFATIGGNFLHIGFNGGVWYIAQVCSFTLTMMSFYYAYNMTLKIGWLPLFLLALAFASRAFQIVYTPIVFWLMYLGLKKNGVSLKTAFKKYLWWVAPALAVGVIIMIYNVVRFGSPFEFGYAYLPEHSVQAGSVKGNVNPAFFSENIKRMFDLPSWSDKGILEFPKFNGCAFWLISPIFLAYLIYFVKDIKINAKNPLLWAVTVSFLLHMCILCMHRTLGGSQFGNRYTVDMIPAALLGLALMIKNEKYDITKLMYPLFFWGLGINLVGTVGYLLKWFA